MNQDLLDKARQCEQRAADLLRLADQAREIGEEYRANELMAKHDAVMALRRDYLGDATCHACGAPVGPERVDAEGRPFCGGGHHAEELK